MARMSLGQAISRRWMRRLRRACRPERNLKAANRRLPRIWLDLSLISLGDRGTGVQRVVRNLSSQLCASPPPGWDVVAIASRNGARYVELAAPHAFTGATTGTTDSDGAQAAAPAAGDIFLGLDLAPRIVSLRRRQLMAWRRAGVQLHFMVYDMLPQQHPQWFNPVSSRWFQRWLNSLAVVADQLICISGTARRDVDAWMEQALGAAADEPPRSTVIALGADLGAASDQQLLARPLLSPQAERDGFVLMVGTIEPRKAYDEALDAFESLWSGGDPCTLVIAGRAGWKVDELLRRLRGHREFGRRLLWFDGPSDAELADLYARCRGLLMASRGEGYGLPVVEALHRGKRVLARDIPILREVAGGPGVSYFADRPAAFLEAALRQWLAELAADGHQMATRSHTTSWADSARQLVRALGLPR